MQKLEASLVKKLEELGIGRPSTYAPTITTIQNRKYVVKGTYEGYERNYRQLFTQNNEIKTSLTEVSLRGLGDHHYTNDLVVYYISKS